MKGKIIQAGVLTVVFILALFGFGALTNRGNTDMTTAMEGATLPVIQFETEGYWVNLLAGYSREMNIPAVRDTITPLDKNGCVTLKINAYDAAIEGMSYEVYTLDGKEVLLKENTDISGETITISPGDVFDEDVEAVLRITLHLKEDKSVYYYTRIVQSEEFSIKECLNFTKKLHENILAKKENEITRYLEPNETADNSSLQHVNIHSDVSLVMWGSLKPEIIGDVQWDIKETNVTYTSILLKYQVKCMGDEEEETYWVKEFFKVRKLGEKYYLLAYDRTMNQLFDTNQKVVTVKGIDLGITSDDVTYEVASDGNLVAFVQERELWCYDRNDDSLSLVFGFRNGEEEDIRSCLDQHDIQITTMDDKGNMVFMVYGYMNRGNHEGEVGVAFYYYNHAHSTIEEKVFIASDKAFAVAADELCRLVYYNEESDTLYIMTEGDLISDGLRTGETQLLTENLEDGQYVVSDDGQMVAYQKNGELLTSTEVEVLNFATQKSHTVKAGEGETIRPLGFVGDDFIYGLMRESDKGKTVSGTQITPMYKVEICDKSGTLVKTYAEENIFVSEVFVQDKLVTLKRVKKSSGKYKEVSEDYISSNEEQKESNIYLQSYTSSLKQTQYRLVFEDRISDLKPMIMKPKQIMVEDLPIRELKDHETKRCFYVYGAGKMAGVYTQAGYAVQEADEIEGVVVSSSQTYVWERGNQQGWYQIPGLRGRAAKKKETTLDVCLDLILEYEEVSGADTDGLEPLEVLEQYSGGEALDLTGCSTENLCYMIGNGTPVVAMTGSNSAYLLIGYHGSTIVYIDPADGKIKTHSMKVMDELTEGSGHTFLGYAKAQKYE